MNSFRRRVEIGRCRSLLEASGVLAVVVSAVSSSAFAQQAPASRVIDRVTAASDTSKHYALLLPAGPDSGRGAPVLLVMDPRGAARSGLNRFRAAAERHGWMILSSYETASDDPNAPNVGAANAMLADAEFRWKANTRRVYFAGFSGTARLVWSYAAELRKNVAGMIGAGAGIAPYPELAEHAKTADSTFSFAGSAGTLDFNWVEVRETERFFDKARLASRFWYYEGPHAWPPPPVIGDMVDWLEYRAMRTGLAAPHKSWMDSVGSRYASSALASGDRRAEQRLVEREKTCIANVRGALTRFREEPAAGPARLERLLNLKELAGRRASADSYESQSANRCTEYVLVYLLFYEPRAHLSTGDTTRAMQYIRVGAGIDSVRARSASASLFGRQP